MNVAVVVLIIIVTPLVLYASGSLAWDAMWAGSDGRLDAPDCREFRFDADRWDDMSGDDRAVQAKGLARCDLLVGMTRSQVEEMIGVGSTERNGFISFDIPENGAGHRRYLRVRFRRSEVEGARFIDPPGFDTYD